MNFKQIEVIRGFRFYKRRDLINGTWELWILNREETKLELVIGRKEEWTQVDVIDLHITGYFNNWYYSDNFTDQEYRNNYEGV